MVYILRLAQMLLFIVALLLPVTAQLPISSDRIAALEQRIHALEAIRPEAALARLEERQENIERLLYSLLALSASGIVFPLLLRLLASLQRKES